MFFFSSFQEGLLERRGFDPATTKTIDGRKKTIDTSLDEVRIITIVSLYHPKCCHLLI